MSRRGGRAEGAIVALMGTGLKLDRPLAWTTWRPTWRLLGIAMPVNILATGLLGWWVLGLAPASAMLLGAVVAPTGPVLASDVQVGPPGEGDEDEVRFALTPKPGSTTGWPSPSPTLPSPPSARRAWASGSGGGSSTTSWSRLPPPWC